MAGTGMCGVQLTNFAISYKISRRCYRPVDRTVSSSAAGALGKGSRDSGE